MYLPRDQVATLYTSLVKTTHPLSAPVLILTALTVDSLCATRILTALLKRDYIAHKVQPVSGYGDLARAGQELVLPLTRQRGGDGAVVVCLGVGGLIDVEEVLGLDGQGPDGVSEDMRDHGVEVWIVDARRPWNLQNVFGSGPTAVDSTDGNAVMSRQGVDQGKLLSSYRLGKGGVIVWDDGDIETELAAERDAFIELQTMPEIDEEDIALGASADSDDESNDLEPNSSQNRKRKASSQDTDDEVGSDDDNIDRPRQRRRSNSSSPIPSSPGGNPRSGQAQSPPPSSQLSPGAVVPSSPPKAPSQRQLKRRLLKMRRKHEATLEAYYRLGTSYAEPVSSMLYSLASELGREENDLLWLAIVGISSVDLSPLSGQPSTSSSGRRAPDRAEQIREVLRDEVRRLNPIPDSELRRSQSNEGVIPIHGRSPTDSAIRLSPEPKFLLIRHWSLYDSMLHSPFLSTRLHVWSEAGKKRLNKLLAKMGVSLQEAGKGYVHMDMDIKRSLRARILKFAEVYNLEGLVPGDDGRTGQQGWGFVRSWGWKATLSAVDVAMVVGAILEVGTQASGGLWDGKYTSTGGQSNYNARVSAMPTPPHSEDGSQVDPNTMHASEAPDWTTSRFFAAYDALAPTASSHTSGVSVVQANISIAQHLHRAILRTGSALIAKKQIRHLRSFKMGVVKEGPDTPLFCHPGALTKLAGWVSEAVAVLEAEKGRRRRSAADEALVLGCLDTTRNVFVVVGLGNGAGGRGRVKSKAEIKEREEKRKRKLAATTAKKAERKRKREERRRFRREIQEANGLVMEEDESEEDTESEGSDDEGSDASDSESDEEVKEARKKRGYGLNRFGQAFQEVVEETGARVRIDSFEHSVVEVKKDDLGGFLEALSVKTVVG